MAYYNSCEIAVIEENNNIDTFNVSVKGYCRKYGGPNLELAMYNTLVFVGCDFCQNSVSHKVKEFSETLMNLNTRYN